MNRPLALTVFAVCTVVLTAPFVTNRPKGHMSTAFQGSSLSPRLEADGGAPMPPWPQLNGLFVADGGAPMPPWSSPQQRDRLNELVM
jgi:hypothetical protein